MSERQGGMEDPMETFVAVVEQASAVQEVGGKCWYVGCASAAAAEPAVASLGRQAAAADGAAGALSAVRRLKHSC